MVAGAGLLVYAIFFYDPYIVEFIPAGDDPMMFWRDHIRDKRARMAKYTRVRMLYGGVAFGLVAGSGLLLWGVFG